MKKPTLLPFVLLATLFACGADADAGASARPGARADGADARPGGKPVESIAGHWTQVTGTDAKGMTLELDAWSDKLLVHTAPAADGTHDHLNGTYTFDRASQAVTVKCELLGKGKGEQWEGNVDGERLALASGGTQLTFRKGSDPHAGK